MQKLSAQKTYLIIAILIVISIIVRLPNLNRPLSKHHEFNAAMILNVCNSWQIGGGASKFNFTPVTFYSNNGDIYVGQHSMVANGKLYYASMGPLQFLAPYYFFKIFNFSHTPLSLQIFAIFMHIILVILFVAFLSLMFKNKSNKNIGLVFGTAVLLILPNFLWFFSNAFNHESLVLLFYLLILIASKLQQELIKNLILFLAIFLGLLTDWFILVIAVFYFLYSIYFYLKTKEFKYLITSLIIACSVCISLLLIYILYSAELGDQKFINLLKEKWLSRSNSFDADFWKFRNPFYVYFVNICSSYLILFILFLLLIKKSMLKYLNKLKSITWILLLLAPITYNFALLEFSVRHDYANLKYAFGLIVCASYLIYLNINLNKVKWIKLIVVVSIANVFLYYIVNNSFFVSYNFKNKYYQKYGTYINKYARDSATIFINQLVDNYPIIMYYAKRNVQFVNSETDFNDTIKKYHLSNAQLFLAAPQKDNLYIEIVNSNKSE